MVVTLTRMRNQQYLDVSESFERWTGWRRDDVIGRTPLDIGLWVNPAERSEFVGRLLAEGVVRNMEAYYRRKDGMELIGLVSAELIEIGNEQCALSVIADISERKLGEKCASDTPPCRIVRRRNVAWTQMESLRIGTGGGKALGLLCEGSNRQDIFPFCQQRIAPQDGARAF